MEKKKTIWRRIWRTKGALVPVSAKHHPTVTEPQEIGALLRAIDDLNGYPIVRFAIQFGILTFVRPGELRNAEWSEVDLGKKEWRIPAGKMKMRRPHIVPLSKQATEILDDVRFLTGHERFVFPSTRSFDRPMSENTVNAALRRMGYAREDLTGHGFRAMASTILNEQGWPADAIERQLAHVEGNSVRAAYNYAEHLDIRRKMMQSWADWLDEVRKDPNR
ncbi:MAG: site-specific integrase [Thermovirgaceae bacterium]|nr:site-specific integrase [Thermovirgaceae bacterium]